MAEAASSGNADTFCTSYREDQPLSLTVKIDGGEARKIEAKILRVHQPFTLSCVLTVEMASAEADSIGFPGQAILKLYDRRFASQLRSDQKIEPWSEATEQAYHEFVSSGEAAAFVKRWREDDDFEEPEEGFSPAENEAYLYNECSDLFSTEVRAYEVLQSLQGKQIPKLYATVSISLDSDKPDEGLLTTNGLLLEYIPGPTLSDMVDSVPQEKWQTTVDKAVKVVQEYSLLGLLNNDVRPSNFLIDDVQDRVVMLDFALCKFREPEQSDAEWGREKWTQDEEGAVGAVMRTRLEKLGFDLKYEPSFQWFKYAPGEDD